MSESAVTTPPKLMLRTVLTYLLWGTLFFALVQILAVIAVFFVGVLAGRDDLGFFAIISALLFGWVYPLFVFSPAWAQATVIAIPFLIVCGFAVAFWNRANKQTSYAVPGVLGAVLGVLIYLLMARVGLHLLPPEVWPAAITDVAATTIASLMAWRRFRKKVPIAS